MIPAIQMIKNPIGILEAPVDEEILKADVDIAADLVHENAELHRLASTCNTSDISEFPKGYLLRLFYIMIERNKERIELLLAPSEDVQSL